jgi:hypothetical protein
VRITLKHRFDFGHDRDLVGDDLRRPEAWDALRTRTTGAFALPDDRAEWERVADEHSEIAERARWIHAWLREHQAGSLASYGVGAAVLELWLMRIDPGMDLAVTEYASATVERLRRVFPEASVLEHDLLRGAPVGAEVHLFHRIDTELDNSNWKAVFERFAEERVLFLTQPASGRLLFAELRKSIVTRHTTEAGFVRNRAALEALWSETHVATGPFPVGDILAWALEPRSDAR